MEERTGWERAVEKTAQALDLPLDAVGTLPHLTLLGDAELRIENHRGILAYGTEEIHVGGGRMVIRVTGENLRLRAMNAAELLISGVIRAVELI